MRRKQPSLITNKCCQDGCLKCQVDQITNQEECSQCMDGYIKNSNQIGCSKTACEQFQLNEIQNENSNKCVSICNQQSIANPLINKCESAYDCQVQYVQPSQLSKGRQIQDTSLDKNGNIQVIYNNFINFIDSKNSQFIRTINFDVTIQMIKKVNDSIYLISNKGQLFQWYPDSNYQQPVLALMAGVFNSKSEIIAVSNNKNRLFISSYIEQQKQMILTEINQDLVSLPTQISYIKIAVVQNNFVILQDLNNKVEILNLVEDQNKEVFLNKITTDYICDGILGIFLSIQQIIVDNNIYLSLIFDKTPGFRIISISDYTCKFYKSDQTVLKILPNEFFSLDTGVSFSFLACSFQPNLISIYNIRTQKWEFLHTLNSIIIDFQMIKIQNNVLKVFILSGSKTVDIYLMTYEELKSQINFNLSSSFNVLISNPMKLQVKSYLEINNVQFLCVESNDLQLFDAISEQSLGILIDFKEKPMYSENKINSYKYVESQNLSISCSLDGKINIWQTIDPLQAVLFYQILRSESCNEITIFQDYIGIAKYSSNFVLFNIFNSQLVTVLPYNPTSFSKAIANQNFYVLVYNQRFSIWKDLSGENLTFSFVETIKNIYLVFSDKIISADTANKIRIYYVDLNNKSVTQTLSLNISPAISFIMPITLLTGDAGIMLTNSENKLYIYDDSLNQIYTEVQLAGVQVLQVLTYSNSKYFINISQPSVFLTPFATLILDVKSTTLSLTIFQQSPLQLTIFQILIRDDLQYLKLSQLIPIGSLSVIAENYIYYSTNQYLKAQLIQIQGDVVGQIISNKQKSIYFSTSTQTGNIQAGTNNRIFMFDKFFTYPKTIANDSISFLMKNFITGHIYIATKYFLFVYNFHTLQPIDNYNFQTTTPTPTANEAIINTVVSEKIGYYAAFINENQGNKYFLSTIQPNSILKYINGCYFDLNQNKIIIFGDILVQFNLDLTSPVIISQSQQNQFDVCIFFTKVVVCKINGNSIIIYNRQDSFSLIIVLQIVDPALSNFQLTGDEQYENIIVFQKIAEVYSFQGLFKARFTEMEQTILQILVTREHLVCLTNGGGQIYKRTNLSFQTSFLPTGPTLLKGYYLQSINVIAYLTNEIKYGQIKYFSLDSMLLAGFISSAQTDNGIGSVLQIYYDTENNHVLYMDVFGNLYIASYGSQMVILNQQGIREVQNKETPPVIDFILDLNSNQIFIYNPYYVWRFDYNILLKQFYKHFRSDRKFYLQLNSNQQQARIQLLYCDENNNLFHYNNYKIVFQKRYTNSIYDMRNFRFKNTNISVIALQDSLQIYIGEISSSLSGTNYQMNNLRLLKYLLIEDEAIVAQTFDNQILDIDFINNKINLSVQITQNTLIASKLIVQTSTYWFLYLSLQTQEIVRIDLINKEYIIYTIPSLTSIVVKMELLSQTQICLVQNDGSALTVNQSDMTPTDSQTINDYIVTKKNLINDFQSTKVPFFEVDVENNRYFISMPEEVKMGVFNLKDNSFIEYITFPDVQWKRMDRLKKYIILSNCYQLNIYNQDLTFLNRFRQLKYLQLSDIRIITDDIIVVIYLTQLQILAIDSLSKTITSINTLNVLNSNLIGVNFLSSTSVQLIGIHKTGILDQVISLSYINQQNNIQSNTPQYCISQILYQNCLQAQNEFDNYYRFQYNQPINYQISILINNQIQQMSFLKQNNVQFILRPQSANQRKLNLNYDSFKNIKSDIKLSSFDIQLMDQCLDYTFQPTTKNIAIAYSSLSNQDIQTGTRIKFENLISLQITEFNIENLNMINQKENNNQNRSSKYLIDQTQSLFYIENVSYVLIENMTIKNLVQRDSSFTLFIISKADKIVIKNLNIDSSILSGELFNFIEVNSLRIEKISIQNCQKFTQISRRLQSSSSDSQEQYVFNLQGIQLSLIKQFNALNCQNISILKSNNVFLRQGYAKSLNNEEIYIFNSQFSSNLFPNMYNIDSQIHLINIQNTYVKVQDLIFQNNQANIYISHSGQVEILSSQLSGNKGVTGASLQLENISVSAQVTSCTFTSNDASASGGAILSTDVNQFNVDSNTVFSKNSAQIGGSIRVMITTMNNINQIQNLNSKILATTHSDNKAFIFGNNVASYPYEFKIYRTYSTKDQQSSQKQSLIYQGQFFSANQQNLLLSDIQSGGDIQLDICIFDENGEQLFINTDLLNQNKYSQPIVQELQYFLFEFSNSNNDQSIEVKGDSFLTAKQYLTPNKTFTFKNLVLAGVPQSLIDSVSLKLRINPWQSEIKISSQVQFRNCRRGEIYVQTTQQIIICKECSYGTYSLQDPFDKDNLTEMIKDNEQICKKCPEGSSSCEMDKIELEVGYWRESTLTDVIIQCNQFKPTICNTKIENRNGCIQGHIGPLCETCDLQGRVWEGKIYTQSLNKYDCSECSGELLQIFYVVLLFLIIFAYLLISVNMFMKNYTQNSVFTYMRLMKILAYSRSCFQDESTSFIKTFINYLQLSYILVNLNFNFIPLGFSYFPSFVGQPVGKIVISSSCLYTSVGKSLGLTQEIKLRTIIFILLPLFFLAVITLIFALINLCILKGFKIRSYHCYTLLNVLFFFFQPDSISFYVQTLTCRQIGNNSYVTTSLEVLCNEESFMRFRGIVIVPMLVFWTLFPAVILIKFIKDKRKSYNLQFCTMKFKYGYFYLEFKQNYYFWEFLRIYLKIFVVQFTAILGQRQNISETICIVIFTFYISGLRLYSPFQSQRLNNIESISYIVIICNLLFNQVNQIYNFTAIQVIMMAIHYIQIIAFVWIIIKIKIFETDSKVGDFFKLALQKFLPRQRFQKLFKPKADKLKILLQWKKIYNSLAIIRQKKLSQQIDQITNFQKKRNSIAFSIRNKEETIYEQMDELRSKAKSINKYTHSILTSPKDDARTLNTEKNGLLELSPGASNKSEKYTRFVFSLNNTDRSQKFTTKRDPSIVQYQYQENNNELVENQTLYNDSSTKYPQKKILKNKLIINNCSISSDSIEEDLPNQIYNQKIYNSNKKNNSDQN